jgi:hypothetical protein
MFLTFPKYKLSIDTIINRFMHTQELQQSNFEGSYSKFSENFGIKINSINISLDVLNLK